MHLPDDVHTLQLVSHEERLLFIQQVIAWNIKWLMAIDRAKRELAMVWQKSLPMYMRKQYKDVLHGLFLQQAKIMKSSSKPIDPR